MYWDTARHFGRAVWNFRIFLLTLWVMGGRCEDLRAQTPISEPAQSSNTLMAGAPDSRSGVLLVHDWFGITPFTRDVMARLADAGIRVSAIDLYDGQSATTHEEAGQLMGELGRLPDEDVDDRLRDAVERLAHPGRQICIIGFSMGGSLAVRATLLSSDLVSCTVVVYGGGIEQYDAERLRHLPGPILAVTGSDDEWAMNSVSHLMTAVKEGEQPLEVYIYPDARHAFSQPLYAEGANLDPEAWRATWTVVRDFLDRHLTR